MISFVLSTIAPLGPVPTQSRHSHLVDGKNHPEAEITLHRKAPSGEPHC